MVKKPKLPPANFREWASTLMRIESLADAALCTLAGSHAQNQLLRAMEREARVLRQKFVRQMEKETRK